MAIGPHIMCPRWTLPIHIGSMAWLWKNAIQIVTFEMKVSCMLRIMKNLLSSVCYQSCSTCVWWSSKKKTCVWWKKYLKKSCTSMWRQRAHSINAPATFVLSGKKQKKRNSRMLCTEVNRVGEPLGQVVFGVYFCVSSYT